MMRYGLDNEDLSNQKNPLHETDIEKKLEKSLSLVQQDLILQTMLLKV